MMHAFSPPPFARPRLAVLIDAENISHRIADKLFEEISAIGDAPVRRIYGDFSSPSLEPWKAAVARHALMPQQTFRLTTGKNGADIALTIDAMDLLHQGGLDGFCLISSDSDFTRLALRLREAGIAAHGFGERKAPEALKQACTSFCCMESVSPPKPAHHMQDSDPAQKPAQPQKAAQKATQAPAPQQPAKATPLLKKAFAELEIREDGWACMSRLGHKIRELHPGFKSKTFGYASLSKLIKATGHFDIELHDKIMHVRAKHPVEQKP